MHTAAFFFKTFDSLEIVLIHERETSTIQYGFLVIPYSFPPRFQCLSPTQHMEHRLAQNSFITVQSILQVFEDLTCIKQLQCSGVIDLLCDMPG